MIIRDVKKGDGEIVGEWRDKFYPKYGVPSLTHSLCAGMVEDVKGPVGYGIVKAYAEAIIFLDGERSEQDKVRALLKLENEMEKRCKGTGVEKIYANIHPSLDRYANELIRHFGFKDIEGRSLVLDLRKD